MELLSHLNEYAVSCADHSRLLVDGGELFVALAQRVDEAQHHVHIEFYIWQNDARGNEMLARLAAAAPRRGSRLLLAPKYYPRPECVLELLVQPVTDAPDGPGDPIEMSIVWMFNIARHRVWLTAVTSVQSSHS